MIAAFGMVGARGMKRLKQNEGMMERQVVRYDIVFKPLEEKDCPLFFAWVKKPHIAQWWQSGTYEAFVEKYRPERCAKRYILPFIMCINEKPIFFLL